MALNSHRYKWSATWCFQNTGKLPALMYKYGVPTLGFNMITDLHLNTTEKQTNKKYWNSNNSSDVLKSHPFSDLVILSPADVSCHFRNFSLIYSEIEDFFFPCILVIKFCTWRDQGTCLGISDHLVRNFHSNYFIYNVTQTDKTLAKV